MKCVVDASVAVKWVLPEEGSDLAQALCAQELLAPELWLSEAANAIWKRHRAGYFSKSEVATLLGRLCSAPVRSKPIGADIEAALGLAVELDHPVYDCLYLACARREDCDVVTADSRFVAAAGRRPDLRGRVRLLGADR